MTVDATDLAFMKRALALARKAQGDVLHYPMVGAVVVKSGKVVGEGYFHRPGEPHAEVNALGEAGHKARGADLILNLEPCSHYGRTPPCAKAVIEAGVKRVVAGMTDPNPLVSGKGFRMLKRAGIEVVAGVMEKECRELNRVFIKFISTRRPYTIMKAAATLDGYLAAASGDARWITGEAARKEGHRLRDRCQAIMVGAGTIRRDDPSLTARMAGKHRHPRPVIVSSRLDLDPQARVFRSPVEGGPLVFTLKSADAGKAEALRAGGAEVVAVRKQGAMVDLEAVMEELGKRNIASVLIEGGPTLHGAALRAGLVDEVALFYAPRLLGGAGLSMTGGPGPARIADAIALEEMQTRRVGEDLMVTGKIKRY